MLSLAVVFQPAPAGAQENGATVSSVVFTSPAKTYAIGDTIEVTVTFSEAVTVTEAGTDKPQIEIDVGGTPRQAEYESGSGTAALVFGYTVAAGDADSDGIAIGADKLTTPGALRRTSATGCRSGAGWSGRRGSASGRPRWGGTTGWATASACWAGRIWTSCWACRRGGGKAPCMATRPMR